MRWLYFLIGCLTVVFSHGQVVMQVSGNKAMMNIAYQASFIEDPTGKLTIGEVLRPDIGARFKQLGTRIVNFGLSSSAYWIRTTIRNNTTEKVIIEVGNNSLSEIRLYETTQNQVVEQFHTGNWLSFDKREIKNVNYLFPLTIRQGEQATIYLRVKHYRGTQFRLKAGTLVAYYEMGTRRSLLEGMYYGFMLMMVLYNFFLYFSLRDRSYFYYVVYIFFMALLNAAINGFAFRYLWPAFPIINRYDDIIAALAGCAGVLFAANFLNTRQNTPFFHKIFGLLLAVYLADILLILAGYFQIGVLVLEINSLVLVFSFFIAAFQTMRNGYRPAKFFLIAWSFLLLSVVIFIMSNFNIIPSSTFATHSIQIGSAVEALLLSMALANRINVYKREKQKAQQAVLRSLEKNKKLIVEQNMMLERKVEERTVELKKANSELTVILQNLKEAQARLVQKEKMASFGELTAGIAHEIQNPLNFVNNFSEVSSEMVDELKKELEDGRWKSAAVVADDLKENLKKITHHGRRAESIVKGMLQHSRTGKDNREPANLNAMVEESLRMAYYSVRSRDNRFSAITETHFDEDIGDVEVVLQDICRVFINMFNNAFYSVAEKKKQLGGSYQPVVSVSTRKENGMIIISIRDNGLGIPSKVRSKIYQPFFTTKPAGEGAGLGLSLSYDIITKGHGGDLLVETEEGEGAVFLVKLPVR